MSDATTANAVIEMFGRIPGAHLHDSPEGLPISSDEYDDMPVFEFKRANGRVFVIISRDADRVSLDWLEAIPTRQGHGEAVLTLLLDLADQHGAAIRTIPKGGAPKLIALYERNGFAAEPNREKWLYRPGTRAAAT